MNPDHTVNRYGAHPERSVAQSMMRGFLNRCPKCGEGRVFGSSFLRTEAACEQCGEEFHHHRADDLPAYLVIFIVGHVVVAAFLAIEAMVDLPLWQHMALWGPLTVLASLALLRPVKGAVVGLQWALYMHGFGGEEDQPDTHPEL
ncbi:MAG: DUF983 domain-containing protein [Rhizobiaceae bacterium]|nr:DUF983 domain-containing protein [Rhizobiaceae bacterium]MCV0406271.1 DUF983 domain-containing protein [Rhizobiaceae bacterium]